MRRRAKLLLRDVFCAVIGHQWWAYQYEECRRPGCRYCARCGKSVHR